MPYCTQCVDQNTGAIGCFGYDPAAGNRAGEFRAITPVFPDLVAFYQWARERGIVLSH